MSVRAFSLVLTAIVFGACGDDTSSSGPITPPDPPGVGIVRIDTVPSASPDRTPVPLPCGGAVIVELSLTRFELRPPGTCGATPRCGHVIVTATETLTGATISARSITPRALLSLSPPARYAGSVRFDARLVDDSGASIETADGQPITATASTEFEFTDTCTPTPGEGGAGGAPNGEGGEAGSGVIAGAGGAGGEPHGGAGEQNLGGEAGSSSEGGGAGGSDAGAGGELTAAGASSDAGAASR